MNNSELESTGRIPVIALGGLGVQSWNWSDVEQKLQDLHRTATKKLKDSPNEHCQNRCGEFYVFDWPRIRTLPTGSVHAAFPTLDNESKALARFIERVAPGQRVCLVAHSMGGFIAEDYAFKYPNRIAGIVFVDTSVATSKTTYYGKLRAMKYGANIIAGPLGKKIWQAAQLVITKEPLQTMPSKDEQRLIKRVPKQIVWNTAAAWAVYDDFAREMFDRRQRALQQGDQIWDAPIIQLVAEAGNRSGTWYETQQSMSAELQKLTQKRCELRLYLQSQHNMMREKPNVIVEAICDVLR